jgi:SAM-dependent methyltransferase
MIHTPENAAKPCVHNAGPDRLPGHWLLASTGKRVLRPGGLELTRWMLQTLTIGSRDDVVEFAPGLGVTAERILARRPRSYIAVEQDAAAAAGLSARLNAANTRCIEGTAEATGLPSTCASVVLGEAMLTMHPHAKKFRILREAHRLLRPGGRYGIHEMCLLPDDIAPEVRLDIEREMSLNIHTGVKPLTVSEWRALLISAEFIVVAEHRAPMHLLEPRRMLADEGYRGIARIAWNLLTHPAARRRVLSMRSMFRRFGPSLAAVSFLCIKEG